MKIGGQIMPAYKCTLKNGKTMWYAAFNYTDWTGQNKHTCKRGFKTQRDAKEYERWLRTLNKMIIGSTYH